MTGNGYKLSIDNKGVVSLYIMDIQPGIDEHPEAELAVLRMSAHRAEELSKSLHEYAENAKEVKW